MSYLMIRHRVEDFGTWKLAYNAHLSARQAAGLKEAQLMHNVDDSNEVVALFEVHDIKKAQEFVSSPSLQDAMQKAGVLGKPDIMFLDAE
jgi:hypothetical protein